MFLKPGSFVHILLLALQVLKSSCQIQYAAIGNPAVKYTGDVSQRPKILLLYRSIALHSVQSVSQHALDDEFTNA